ncbi:MAG: HEAT repeat domain-containing protein [Planctomycetota bacterium]
MAIVGCESPDVKVRRSAVRALGDVGGEKTLAFLEKALADHDVNMRRNAASVLSNVGGEKALAILEKALADQDANQDIHVLESISSALRQIGGEKAMTLLAKAEKAKEGVKKMIADRNVSLPPKPTSTKPAPTKPIGPDDF